MDKRQSAPDDEVMDVRQESVGTTFRARIRVAGVFSTTISYGDISEVASAKETGIVERMRLRILPNSTTGYLVGGPSVRITTGSSAVLVSSSAPDKLVEAIERRRMHTAP
ncbi:hypothetical protein [Arthrobacter roseus]|uniref:hypothetical protein n=1 Tax=Arthrobacter roseus TaxID=136274 RepID=UPI0019622C6F|nr:hypothetical protein [Arthrobacter roseus]MBM7848119.1 hypothetical protein [Arthrobacter roseus]